MSHVRPRPTPPALLPPALRHGRARTAAQVCLVALLATSAVGAVGAVHRLSAQQDLRTAAEASDWERYTSHEEMWAYLEDLRASTTEMKLGAYGETWEGRELPYAILSRPTVTQPWEAWALHRPILVLAANVHGGERTLREALLVLMRDLVTPGTEAYPLLDEVVVVAAPQINPDGFEASPRATRGNARGIDLNRDYVKLEHPEIASYVGNVLQTWQPHLFVDGHNGGSFPYNLNYQCPSHADPDPRITALCDDEIFPAVGRKLGTEGFEAYYYTGGNEEEWRVGGNEARIGRNYGGFANMVGILFESPPRGQDLRTGARAGYLGYLAVVEYAAANAGRLMETVDRARRETVLMGMRGEGDVVVEMEYGAEPEPAVYKIAPRPQPGAQDAEPEIVTVTDGRLMKRPVPLKTRPRPYAYVLPPEARDAVAMLRRHHITVEVLDRPASLTVDAYTLADVAYERAYDHDAATRVTVGDVVTLEREFPAGSFVVSTAQMMGRLVAHMLEPESTDNVVYWNTMDAWLPKARLAEEEEAGPGGAAGAGGRGGGFGSGARGQEPPLIPIFKLMVATPLPTRLMEG